MSEETRELCAMVERARTAVLAANRLVTEKNAPRADPFLNRVEDLLDEAALAFPDRDALAEEKERLERALEQMTVCANMIRDAIENEDGIAWHYGAQGLIFEAMRADWLLGNEDEARKTHATVGDHSPDGCPVCVGDKAFAALASPEGAADA